MSAGHGPLEEPLGRPASSPGAVVETPLPTEAIDHHESKSREIPTLGLRMASVRSLWQMFPIDEVIR